MRPTGCGSPRRLGANPAPENRRDLRAARTTHTRERGFFLRSRWMTWFREQGRAFSLKPPLQCHSRLRVWLWWCVSSVSCCRWPGLLLPFCRSLLFLVIKFLVICSGRYPTSVPTRCVVSMIPNLEAVCLPGVPFSSTFMRLQARIYNSLRIFPKLLSLFELWCLRL